jgi:hypothetical protein
VSAQAPQPLAIPIGRNLKATFNLTAAAGRRNPSIPIGNLEYVSLSALVAHRSDLDMLVPSLTEVGGRGAGRDEADSAEAEMSNEEVQAALMSLSAHRTTGG